MEVAGDYKRMDMPKCWQNTSNQPMYTIVLKKTEEQEEKEKIDKEWNEKKFKVTGKVGQQ